MIFSHLSGLYKAQDHGKKKTKMVNECSWLINVSQFSIYGRMLQKLGFINRSIKELKWSGTHQFSCIWLSHLAGAVRISVPPSNTLPISCPALRTNVSCPCLLTPLWISTLLSLPWIVLWSSLVPNFHDIRDLLAKFDGLRLNISFNMLTRYLNSEG